MNAVMMMQKTRAGKPLGAVRIFLGMLFLSTGLMKLLMPDLRAAFSGQLSAANIPLHAVNMWLVPFLEVVVGLLMLAGLFTRMAAMLAMVMMIVATYVHLVVHRPELFPLQPQAPTMPLLALALCALVLWMGGGSWSLDLRQQRRRQQGDPSA